MPKSDQKTPPLGISALVIRAMAPIMLGVLTLCAASSYFIFQAQRRHVRQDAALEKAADKARRMEQFLEGCRQDLLLAAAPPLSAGSLVQRLAVLRQVRGVPYMELAWTPLGSGEPQAAKVAPGAGAPVLGGVKDAKIDGLGAKVLAQLAEGGPVLLGLRRSIERPRSDKPPAPDSPRPVFRLALACENADGEPGALTLAVDAREARNRLGVPPAKPGGLWQEGEDAFSWFADASGWILFQSAAPGRSDRPLETYLARTGMDGALGRSGLASAFRPANNIQAFWDLMEKLKSEGQGRKLAPGVMEWPMREEISAFAPVRFKTGDGEASIIGAVVYADRREPAFQKVFGLEMCFLAAGLLLFGAAVAFLLRTRVSRPLQSLAAQIVHADPALETLFSAGLCRETALIVRAMTSWTRRNRRNGAMLDRAQSEAAREPALIEEPVRDADLPELIGDVESMAKLKREIRKAASANADILIIGETGTGKQLAAEAVHRLSERRKDPFISINCGALDDNLLLDALFGHAPGAFTQARTARRGAFAEAHGGSIFLDEIQNASPKTQQALLRVLTERRFRPLGSDEEIPVDVRVIAGSNKELARLIPEGSFREDLFYRLNVIVLRTTPLREQPRSIPILAGHFLRQAEDLVEAGGLSLSRGALDKLTAYSWPGNVRELINCVTRAAVMAEGSIIMAGEIKLDEEAPAYLAVRDEEASHGAPPPPLPPLPEGPVLHARQQAAMAEILRRKIISRKDYQEIAGGSLPARTALEDLNDLVRRGLLVRRGKGPATRYEAPAGFGRTPSPGV